MEPNTKTFFISYAREDSDFALKLAKDLRHAGADLWIDQLDIKAGERWDRSIEKALEVCSGMLLILSPDSVGSPNVMDEVSYGLEESKRVLPVMYRACKLPFRLRRVQYIDFTEAYQPALRRLVRDMQVTSSKGSILPAGSEIPPQDQPAETSKSPPPEPGPPGSGPKSNRAWVIPVALIAVVLLAFVGYRVFRSAPSTGKTDLQVVEQKGKFGYENRNGKLVIPFEFDAATPFQGEKAKVRIGDHWFVINLRGECIDNCPKEPEPEAWEAAVEINTIESYRGYIEQFPDGPHQQEARENVRRLMKENSPAEAEDRSVPEEERQAAMEESDWNKVIRENSANAYRVYLEAYPDGKYREVAIERIKTMEEASSRDSRGADKVVAQADVMPEFPGGTRRLEKYLYENLNYPERLRRSGVEGKAYVSYVVEKDGSISTIDVVSASHPDFGKAAVEVFEMFREKGVKFEPGRSRGEAVRVKMVHPVLFNL